MGLQRLTGWMLGIAASVVWLSAQTGPCQAAPSAKEMVFEAIPPLQPAAIFGTTWAINARGPIDTHAADRLRELVITKKIGRGALLFLDSPGGDLYEGMELGRVIRKQAMRTFIGSKPSWEHKGTSGGCYSACALSFLGGEFRFYTSGSKYGTHRFYSVGGDGLSGDIAQIASAAVTEYIREMDVDPQLFSEMVQAGRDGINLLSETRMLALRVANNGMGPTRWTIESTVAGLYLKGERSTVYGDQKLMFLCAQGGKLVASVMFDPQGRGNEVVRMNALTFAIDEHELKLDAHQFSRLPTRNGWVSLLIPLPDGALLKLRNASTVGVRLQHSFDASMFLGIDAIDFKNAREKLSGFLTTCR